MTAVPCNGCTRCCQSDAVRLLPGDDPSQYQTEPHEYLPGALMLAHKPNGDCVYLDATGCSIHDRSPQMCREMDCRGIRQKLSRSQAVAHGILDVWKRGRDLLEGKP